ncbi:MAG: hypothetical protein SH819_08800 [Cytophagales bacterium]|nr:hypothetical protein [Cytophagales bacterium]
MQIREVKDSSDARAFLQLPVRLYRTAQAWIRPLDNDVVSVFDRAKNKSFRKGDCARWILLDGSGEVIGRVAAFVLEKSVGKGNEQPTGGMGFFECIDDQSAAFMLFDQCKAWLRDRGMEAMDGPINFGSREKWWGLLVDGFDQEPNYQCNYNFPYYARLFEAYGFQVYFNQLTYSRKVMEPLSERLAYKATLLGGDPDYDFRFLAGRELGMLAEYLHRVYNLAWANRAGNPDLSLQQARLLVKQMKPILDPHLLWFGFYKGEPISFFISLPEINQIFKHLHGKLNWLGKIKFLWHKARKTNTKAFGILFGVVPEHQGKGVDGAMIMAARRVYQSDQLPYTDYEMNWIGDFNPKMIQVVEQVGARVNKRHITYRKLFDEGKLFTRHPILN